MSRPKSIYVDTACASTPVLHVFSRFHTSFPTLFLPVDVLASRPHHNLEGFLFSLTHSSEYSVHDGFESDIFLIVYLIAYPEFSLEDEGKINQLQTVLLTGEFIPGSNAVR